MRKLTLLIAIALGFGYFYPARHEATATACAALDRRIATTLKLTADSPAGAMAGQVMHQAVTGAVHAAWPFLPAEPGCLLAYWTSLLQPVPAIPARR